MIRGRVNDNLEAVISISIYSTDLKLTTVDAVIDTGFTDYVTLPSDIVQSLGLEVPWITPAVLADGTSTMLAVGSATVRWHDHDELITILVAEGDPLLGMSLLKDCNLHLEVVSDGRVTIERRE